MAFVSLLIVGFLVFWAANGVMCSGGGGGGVDMDMEEEELFGLFEVMGSLLEDPTWAEMHPLPCTETPWPGVECELLDEEDDDDETSIFHVTKIHVGPDNVITPPCKPSAKISHSLLKLPYLKTLSLMNCFTKSPFFLSKSLFGSLPNFLEHLALESNPSLFGEIPNTISNLTNLKILRLSQNNLSGEIPKEIKSLVNLQQLDLSHNNFTGPIPEEIGALEKIAILDLSWNSLQQVIPASIGGLEFLEKIDLSSNEIQGPPPQDLGRLRRLVLLDLSRNKLTGPIPETLANLQQLQYLIMEDNPLNAGIPSFIGSLVKLSVLTFSGCGLTGQIPTTLSNLTNLIALSLDNNRLNGTVPSELCALPSIDMLNLSRNRLSGELLFSRDFLIRLGERLDIRDNDGLCTNYREAESNTSLSRFLQNPSCTSSAMFPAASNRTTAEKNPDRAENLKPKLYDGISNGGSKICPFYCQNYILVIVVWLVSIWFFLGL
ncbi:hypothetical protein ABFS83_13G083100 [Erythranthe nasuta]